MPYGGNIITTVNGIRVKLMTKGIIYAISISPERGQLKTEVPEAKLIENFFMHNGGDNLFPLLCNSLYQCLFNGNEFFPESGRWLNCIQKRL